jgi:hypothetical protein
MHERSTRSRRCVNVNVRTASAQSDWTDMRTTARRNFADTRVALVSHEHEAARINGHTSGTPKAGFGTGRVDISVVGATDPTSERRNHCSLIIHTTITIIATTSQHSTTKHNATLQR